MPEGRHPHSMHCYYLRAGEAEHPTIMKVSRDRDGRSFSARRVEALQRGKAIFTMAALFHVDEESGDWSGVPMRTDVPSPEGSQAMGDDRIRSRDDPHGPAPRSIRRRTSQAEQHASRWMWGRSTSALPDDRVLHRGRDRVPLRHEQRVRRPRRPGLHRGGSSLDHTVYFHRPAHADEWMFMALEPVSAAGARGVYRGSVHDRSGHLLATLVQENLMRPWPEGA